jgi:copper oxidase (laccase) domain-containing protein
MIVVPGTEFAIGLAGAGRNCDLVPVDAVFVNQIHGSKILLNPSGGESADGMIFERGKGIPALKVADCLPVFAIWDDYTGAAHAGWRGLAEGIVENLIASVDQPLRWLILGPCICADCFATGNDVREAVCSGDPSGASEHPRGRVDLRGSAFRRVQYAAGNQFKVINLHDCTMESDSLFSYRSNGTGERNLIWLAETAPGEHIRQPNKTEYTPPERRKS